MPVYRVFEPGEQEVFTHLDNNCLDQITIHLKTLEQASPGKLACELSNALLYRRPHHNAQSIELAAKAIKDSLDDEFQFGLENQWLFKCFVIRKSPN